MEKDNDSWERLDEIYLNSTADILLATSITQEEYNYLKSLADTISYSPLRKILNGALFSKKEEEKCCSLSKTKSIENFHYACEKAHQIIMIFDSNDTGGFNQTAPLNNDIQDNSSVCLAIKMLSCFNYLCVFLANKEQTENGYNYTNPNSLNVATFRAIFQHIGKVFNF